MSYQESRVTVSVVTAVIVFALYAFYMFGLHQSGHFEEPGASSLVGKSTFVLIAASIVVTIVVQILFAIVRAIITREPELEITDERDRLIELKSMKIGFITFSIGFVASMGALALEWLSPPLVFLAIISSMFAASVIGDIAKLALYRRGL